MPTDVERSQSHLRGIESYRIVYGGAGSGKVSIAP